MINNKSALAAAFWEKGRLDDDCPIYDFHGHMGLEYNIYFPHASPDAMVESMKRAGTKKLAFCHHRALRYPEAEQENLNAAMKFPDYFLLYHGVIPHKTSPKEALERVERYKEHYIGFKLHCDYHTTAITDPVYTPFLEYMNEHKLCALMHTWGFSEYDGVEVVAKVAEKYPNIHFFCAHCFHGDWLNGAKLCAQYPNLNPDLTAVMDDCGAIELFCEHVGSDRVFFGTDLPWFDPQHAVGAILSADITDDDRRNIFYRNGIRLLNQKGRPTPVLP